MTTKVEPRPITLKNGDDNENATNGDIEVL